MIALLALAACSSKPADASGFAGCWHDATDLVPNRFAPGLDLADGTGAVLLVEASWGGSWFATDQGRFASLAIGLPADPKTGQVIDLHGRSVQYRQGGQVLAYSVDALDGTVGIVEADEHDVRIQLDARPTAPQVEAASGPLIPLTGVLTVARVTGRRCP